MRRKDVAGAPEAEALLAFKYAIKAASLLAFLIFANAKNHRYQCCLAKMTFRPNKSHLGMCVIRRRRFITIKIFPRGSGGGGTRTRARAGGSALPFLSGAAHDRRMGH